MTTEEQAEVERLLTAIRDRRQQALDAHQAARLGLSVLAELRLLNDRVSDLCSMIRTIERESIVAQLKGIADKFEKSKATVNAWGAVRNAALEVEEELQH